MPAALLVVGFFLSGCASVAPGGGPHSPAPASALPAVPAQWSVDSAAVQPASVPGLASWWTAFGDAQLNDLVADALARHTSVRDAQAVLLQARAVRDTAVAGGLPTVTASTSAQRARSGGATSGLWQAGVDASWEVDLFGRQGAAVAAAGQGVQRDAALLAQARVSLAAEVVLAWLDVRSAQARLVLAQQARASQAASLQLTGWRVDAGLDSSVSLAQSRTAVAQAESAVPALQATLAQSRHALAVLTGRAPAELDGVLADRAELPAPPVLAAPALPADVLRQRPDVRAAEATLLAARHTLDQVRAQRWPSLTLSGTLGLQAATLGGVAGAPLAASALASLAGSLFDGGARQAAIASQDATVQRAQIAWEATVLQALQEVEDALANLAGQRSKALALQRAAEAADSAATLAQQRYASGLIDHASVLDTQRTLISTLDTLAVTRAAALSAQVQLAKALGGGAADTPR